MSEKFKDIETKLIHSGEPRPRIEGAVSMPIFQSSTYEYSGEKSYHDLRYIRLNNTPNHRVLHEKLADLESGEAALTAASGMAAITTTLLTVLSAGEHLLAQRGLYGGTHHFVTEDLTGFGIGHDLIEGNDATSWTSKLRPETRAIFVETITNPLMEVAALEAVVQFAQAHGLVSIIDNTFASPVNFRPLEIGFDLCVHSGTKYLNGHTDIVAGAVIGSRSWITRITQRLNHLGGSLDPHACFLLHRGMKTLALRVRCQNESALRLARFLEDHPAVERVNYAGLRSSPSHERASALFAGFGGMLSFELRGGVENANEFLQALTIPVVAPSLGGVETLVTLPATTSHAGMPAEERRGLGISDGLVRVSVGIESCAELIEDFRQALARISHAGS